MSILSAIFGRGSGSKGSESRKRESSEHRFNKHPAKHANAAIDAAFRLGVKTGQNQEKRKHQ
jgi:hypothetical protein